MARILSSGVTGQQLRLKERWSFYGVSRSRPTLQGGPLRSCQRQERKRLDMLNSLKSLSSPFTDAVEVIKYLAEPTLSEKVKQKRLKLEVQPGLPEKAPAHFS